MSRFRLFINNGGAMGPARATHPPLANQVMQERIKEPLWRYLKERGFKKTDEEWVWIRPRTAWINDYVFASLLTKSAPELYGINLHIGVQCPSVSRVLNRLGDKRHEIIRPLFSPLISELYFSTEKIPSRWNFWNTAFDYEEMEDLLWHLEYYGLPFMETFCTLNDLIDALDKYSNLFRHWPEIQAAIFVLAGRYDEAEQCLKEGLRVSKDSKDDIMIMNKMLEALHEKTLQILVADVLASIEV